DRTQKGVAQRAQQRCPDEHEHQVPEELLEHRQAEDVEGEIVAEERVAYPPGVTAQPREHGKGRMAAKLDSGDPPAGKDGDEDDADADVCARDLLGDLQVSVTPAQVYGAQVPH